jgi:hypothetical protein
MGEKKNSNKQRERDHYDVNDPDANERGLRKEKRRKKRHNDKMILKQFTEYADDYFDNFEEMG